MELHLSQQLLVDGYCSISVPGETDSHFASCDENGCCEWLPFDRDGWFALTDKAKEVFTGKTKVVSDGETSTTLGRVFEYRDLIAEEKAGL